MKGLYIKKDIGQLLPDGVTRVLFAIMDKDYKEPRFLISLQGNNIAFVANKWEDGRLGDNPFTYREKVKVDDIPLDPNMVLAIMAIEINGIVFETENPLDITIDAVDLYTNAYENEGEYNGKRWITHRLLSQWDKMTKTPHMSQSSNLICDLTDERVLDNMLGMFYNSKCGYYATLQKLVDYYAQTKCGVSILDERLNTLRNGFEAVKERREISWDGINFIIGGKK